ncbi:hypothetical protein EV179_003053 [Coemansia sp. RSA 487]|nr:hypothetical protein LPJ74_003432 [Coemansia sp. RSA 1843]KAJ2214388.1 hypothetical protein EV179_003053 [Coemansia sp. RSA 487]
MNGYNEHRSDPYNLLYRYSSHMSMRYMYTHSDYSSSLSSLSTNSQTTVHSHNGLRQRNTIGSQVISFCNQQMHVLRNTTCIPDSTKRLMGLLSMFIIVASSAGLCLIHGIFESSYQFSYTTGKSLEAVSEETEEEAMQSRYTMVIGALQIAGFVGAQGMSGVVGRWLGSARAVLLFGAVLSSGGLLTAGYTGELWQLCLTQGAVVGIGCGVSYGAAIGAFVRLMDAKKQRITLACGAMATGIGGSVLAFVVQRIFLVCGQNTSVTLRWLALLIGGLQAVSILFAGSKWHSTNEPPQNCSGVVLEDQHNGLQLIVLDSNKHEEPKAGQITNSSTGRQTQEPHNVYQTNTWRMPMGAVVSYASVCVYRMTSMVPVLLIPGYVDRILAHGNSGYSGAAMLAALSLASSIGGALGSRLPSAEHTPSIDQMRRSNAMRSILLCLLALSTWSLWLPASRSWAMISIFCTVHGVLFGAMQQNLIRATVVLDGRMSVVAMGALLSQFVFVVVGICMAGWLFVGVGHSGTYAPSIMFAAATSTAAAVLAAISSLSLMATAS